MGINKQEILNKLNESLVEATNKTKLIEINNIFSKNNIAPLYNELKNLSGAEKGEFGKEINELKNEVKKVIDQKMIQIDEEEEKKSHSINYDISLNTSNFKKGALHPISYVFKNLTNFFNKFDFTFEMGNEVEEVKYNFDHLNLAEGHPTRDVSETFYLHDSNITLRTQMTAHSARHLHDNKNEEIRLISPGWVYRNDEDDVSHSHQFHQLDFMWVKEGINFRNLKWLLNSMYRHIYGNDVKTKFMMSNYAFTEPSFEVAATCPFCNGEGCKMCKQSGWIILMGAGIFHENVMKASNVSGKSGIAGGMGIERMACIKFGINDVRDLYKNDFRLINQLKEDNN